MNTTAESHVVDCGKASPFRFAAEIGMHHANLGLLSQEILAQITLFWANGQKEGKPIRACNVFRELMDSPFIPLNDNYAEHLLNHPECFPDMLKSVQARFAGTIHILADESRHIQCLSWYDELGRALASPSWLDMSFGKNDPVVVIPKSVATSPLLI